MERTYLLYREWASRLGCTRVANVSSFVNTGIYVSMAVRPVSKTLTVHQGKGFSQIEADVSALGESIETAIGASCRIKGVTMSSTVSDLSVISKTSKLYQPSGGLAVHTNLENAKLHAAQEFVERPLARDFLMQHKAKYDIPPEIFKNIQKKYSQINWDLFHNINAYILNDDIFYTCAVMIAVNDDLRGKMYFAGFGSRLTLDKAVTASVLEAIQSYVTLVVGMRDDIPKITKDSLKKDIKIDVENKISPNNLPAKKITSADNIILAINKNDKAVAFQEVAKYSIDGLTATVVKCGEKWQ